MSPWYWILLEPWFRWKLIATEQWLLLDTNSYPSPNYLAICAHLLWELQKLFFEVNATSIQVMQVLIDDAWRFFSSGKLCLMFNFSCMQSTMKSFLPMGYNSPWWILKEHKHIIHMGFIKGSPFMRFIHPSIHPWTFISQVGHKHLWKFIWHFHT